MMRGAEPTFAPASATTSFSQYGYLASVSKPEWPSGLLISEFHFYLHLHTPRSFCSIYSPALGPLKASVLLPPFVPSCVSASVISFLPSFD